MCEMAFEVRSKAAKRLSRFPVFDVSRSQPGELIDPHALWTVDHLVEFKSTGGGGSFDRYTFDYVTANREIRALGGEWRETNGWEMVGSSDDESPSTARHIVSPASQSISSFHWYCSKE